MQLHLFPNGKISIYTTDARVDAYRRRINGNIYLALFAVYGSEMPHMLLYHPQNFTVDHWLGLDASGAARASERFFRSAPPTSKEALMQDESYQDEVARAK
ncbi:hypothetical protein H0G86_001658 [Trichoderma simmonsii]|uniref:Uncharacterized protein n=1 Tax=Trichoderma simmonsii TaxID=1491479 RepID=A0A8G0PAQ1_9HYPO|nr:hypothetical protein H0G86_001658 [Trichoderma simmonsii]